jgi:hypothetical protein
MVVDNDAEWWWIVIRCGVGVGGDSYGGGNTSRKQFILPPWATC